MDKLADDGRNWKQNEHEWAAIGSIWLPKEQKWMLCQIEFISYDVIKTYFDNMG